MHLKRFAWALTMMLGCSVANTPNGPNEDDGGSSVCDNGVIDAGETCDPPSSCPTACDDGDACTDDSLSGSAESCNALCTHEAVTACVGGDGCCPSSCDGTNDDDCAECGNDLVESGETCDPPSSCPSCDDGDACTTDTSSGEAASCNLVCENTPVTECTSGDGCCPSGCDGQDDDCAPTVLIVHTNCCGIALAQDVQAKLSGFGVFPAVDLFDATAATPTLDLLQSYGVVLVFSDQVFADPVLMGNRLADYFDGGGQVVTAPFTLCSPNALQGRFGDPAEGYLLLQPGPQAQPTDTLGTVTEPTSPLMKDVNELSAEDAFRCLGGPINGGTVVAAWQSGEPLVVRGEVQGRNRVDLNFFPVSGDVPGWTQFWTGDGAELLRNALLFE